MDQARYNCKSFWQTNICVDIFWSTGIGALISLSKHQLQPIVINMCWGFKDFCQKNIFLLFSLNFQSFYFFLWIFRVCLKSCRWLAATEDSAYNLLTFIWKLWLRFWHISISLSPNFWESGKLWHLRLANTNLHLDICQKLYLDLSVVDKFGFERHECQVSCETEICN